MQTHAEPERWSLDDKYLREEGIVYLTGTQALVRLTLDQHRADCRRGLNTATFISGYRGSPLGGLDVAFERAAASPWRTTCASSTASTRSWRDRGVRQPAGRLASRSPKYDGVLGMWYGKAPGVDRSGDIFKHANFAGVGKNGGVLALAGRRSRVQERPPSPSQSEPAF